MTTAILITLQNIHSQRSSIEERIYKILGDRFESHVPGTISEIKEEIETEKFHNAFFEHLRHTTESEKQQKYVFDKILGELRRKFHFLEHQKNIEKRLRRIFSVSLGVGIVVLLYSMTALITIPPNATNELRSVNGTSTALPFEIIEQTFLFGINPIHALMIAVALVSFSLMVFMQLMMITINIWRLNSD